MEGEGEERSEEQWGKGGGGEGKRERETRNEGLRVRGGPSLGLGKNQFNNTDKKKKKKKKYKGKGRENGLPCTHKRWRPPRRTEGTGTCWTQGEKTERRVFSLRAPPRLRMYRVHTLPVIVTQKKQ